MFAAATAISVDPSFINYFDKEGPAQQVVDPCWLVPEAQHIRPYVRSGFEC